MRHKADLLIFYFRPLRMRTLYPEPFKQVRHSQKSASSHKFRNYSFLSLSKPDPDPIPHTLL